MAVKKSDLYSSLWSACDELRGGMDASQYKDFVLVLLFIKYVSDKYAGQPYAPITIPAGSSFKDLVALKGKPDIGDQINKRIIAPLASANGLSDFPDFNDATKLGSGKEMVDRLSQLIGIFEDKFDFSKNRADGDDILGDAYEYLMRHFATESGKSKGQFYTPAEVSRVIAQVIGIHEADTSPNTTVYDPTCGSGSLLLKVADAARTAVSLYGQEKDATTSGLARMNMILHDYPTAEIMQGNTLADPKFKDGDSLKTFDFVVANPPFSDKRWSTGITAHTDPHGRFQAFGTPPDRQGDYAYLLHIVRSLRSTGTGACILPHGVLFRGNAEADIRRNLLRRGYIKGIIGLPPNLFYGTGIPACIVVIDKAGASERTGVFMIDASAGFLKDGPKNRLRAQDMHKIVDVFKRQMDAPRYARLVSLAEIERNDYNLNLPRYIDSQTPEDRQDIAGHLRGGIPIVDIDALDRYWAVFPSLRRALFRQLPDPTPEAGRHGLPMAYFETCFEAEGVDDCWPDSFAIVSAYAPTGETWPAERNTEADQRLETLLRAGGGWLRRVTGYAPATGHAEPSWAVELDREAARALGKQFGQDAVYVVEGDTLLVSRCAEPVCARVGGFRERVHPAGSARFERPGYAALAIGPALIKPTIGAHPEFAAFTAGMTAHFAGWRERTATTLKALAPGCHPKDVIRALSEDILAHYQGQPLIDAYDIYQHAMNYWEATMQDDVYLITADGWRATPYRVIERRQGKDGKPGKEVDKGWACDLIPKTLLVSAFYADEQTKLDALAAELEGVGARLAELEEEHGGEEGVFADFDKVNKATVTARLRELRGLFGRQTDTGDEEGILTEWLALTTEEGDLKKRLKDAEAALDGAAYRLYARLSEQEVKALVIDGKWLAALAAAIDGELERVSQHLTRRVRELAERYETTAPTLTSRVSELEARVNHHLARMGFLTVGPIPCEV